MAANGKLMKNTAMLYIMTAAKLLLPMLTLPYLTRILSEPTFGVVAYIKAFMAYVQLFIDFGFVLSATKDITLANGDREKLGNIVCNTIFEKLMLAVAALVVLLICVPFIPALRQNFLFVILYYFSTLLSVVLIDFYFRGTERMNMVALPYVFAKTISTAFTLILIKSDSDIIWIPVLEIIGTSIACAVVVLLFRKERLPLKLSPLSELLKDIKESSVFFVSNFATTFLGAFTTIVAGLVLTEVDIAHWSVCIQLTSAVKAMYTPITNSLYPNMIISPKRRTIKMTLLVFMPIIVIGCVFTFVFARQILSIVGGANYAVAGEVMKYLVPVLFISFPGMLFGWPTLGAVGKVKQTTLTTVLAAVVQVISIILMFALNSITLKSLAISCCIAETALFACRYYFYRRYRKLFI